METRGRKPKIFPQEEIDNLVYRFTQEEKVSGWIKYSEVYRYAIKLYENGEIPYKLSEDYWRRVGRQGKDTIDSMNKTYEATIVNKKTSQSNIYVDTEECVDKFFTGKPSDKKRLIEALKINEKKAKDYNELLTKIDSLNDTIKTLVKDKKTMEEKLKQYQTILFSWYYASNKSEVPLINLMTTGKSRHPIVDIFFETTFSNPTEGYNQLFEELRKSIKEENGTSQENTNVTQLRKGIASIREKYKNK